MCLGYILSSRTRGEICLNDLGEFGSRLDDPVRLLLVYRLELLQEREETDAGAPVTVPGGEIGAAVERLTVRGEPQGHRPAATANHRLDGRHVNGIDIRSLLAIHL